ncbi:MAG: hypothetical protein U0414_09640 [Polyangiaceae bacterium]
MKPREQAIDALRTEPRTAEPISEARRRGVTGGAIAAARACGANARGAARVNDDSTLGDSIFSDAISGDSILGTSARGGLGCTRGSTSPIGGAIGATNAGFSTSTVIGVGIVSRPASSPSSVTTVFVTGVAGARSATSCDLLRFAADTSQGVALLSLAAALRASSCFRRNGATGPAIALGSIGAVACASPFDPATTAARSGPKPESVTSMRGAFASPFSSAASSAGAISSAPRHTIDATRRSISIASVSALSGNRRGASPPDERLAEICQPGNRVRVRGASGRSITSSSAGAIASIHCTSAAV